MAAMCATFAAPSPFRPFQRRAAPQGVAIFDKTSKMWGTPFVTQRKLDGLEATLLDSLSAQGGEREVLTRIFKKYDSNADGLLQFDEFERFVENFGIVNKPQDEVRALFERYDSDDSGALAFSEFSAAMLRQVEGHRPR